MENLEASVSKEQSTKRKWPQKTSVAAAMLAKLSETRYQQKNTFRNVIIQPPLPANPGLMSRVRGQG